MARVDALVNPLAQYQFNPFAQDCASSWKKVMKWFHREVEGEIFEKASRPKIVLQGQSFRDDSVLKDHLSFFGGKIRRSRIKKSHSDIVLLDRFLFTVDSLGKLIVLLMLNNLF